MQFGLHSSGHRDQQRPNSIQKRCHYLIAWSYHNIKILSVASQFELCRLQSNDVQARGSGRHNREKP